MPSLEIVDVLDRPELAAGEQPGAGTRGRGGRDLRHRFAAEEDEVHESAVFALILKSQSGLSRSSTLRALSRRAGVQYLGTAKVEGKRGEQAHAAVDQIRHSHSFLENAPESLLHIPETRLTWRRRPFKKWLLRRREWS